MKPFKKPPTLLVPALHGAAQRFSQLIWKHKWKVASLAVLAQGGICGGPAGLMESVGPVGFLYGAHFWEKYAHYYTYNLVAMLGHIVRCAVTCPLISFSIGFGGAALYGKAVGTTEGFHEEVWRQAAAGVTYYGKAASTVSLTKTDWFDHWGTQISHGRTAIPYCRGSDTIVITSPEKGEDWYEIHERGYSDGRGWVKNGGGNFWQSKGIVTSLAGLNLGDCQ